MSQSVEITANLVKSWFPASRFGEPNDEACQALAQRLEYSRKIHDRHGEEEHSLQLLLFEIGEGARKLVGQLEQLESRAGAAWDPDLAAKVANAKQGLENFQGFENQRGRSDEWINSADAWAPLVAKCLARSGKSAPSISSANGPVAKFLGRALLHIYGQNHDAVDVARRLQERATKKVCPPNIHPEVAKSLRNQSRLEEAMGPIPKLRDIK